MQGLGGAALVFEDTDAGVEREPGKDDAACRHDENLGGVARNCKADAGEGRPAGYNPAMSGRPRGAGAVNKG
ncbi:hypothetical protein ADE_33000 [Achromobacter denitrificans]|nr:hypothetical protein ADE_33000 [Achromobacter denitrificans]